jgi:hypothetical protein
MLTKLLETLLQPVRAGQVQFADLGAEQVLVEVQCGLRACVTEPVRNGKKAMPISDCLAGMRVPELVPSKGMAGSVYKILLQILGVAF